MSKTLTEAFGALAEGLEAAAAAARTIEGAYANASAKSADSPANAVAGKSAGSKGPKVPIATPVAAKSAGKGKVKAPVITFEDIKAKLTEVMAEKGKQAVKDLLSEFGIAKLTELEEDNYGELHAKAVELMAADEVEDESEDDDMFGSD